MHRLFTAIVCVLVIAVTTSLSVVLAQDSSPEADPSSGRTYAHLYADRKVRFGYRYRSRSGGTFHRGYAALGTKSSL